MVNTLKLDDMLIFHTEIHSLQGNKLKYALFLHTLVQNYYLHAEFNISKKLTKNIFKIYLFYTQFVKLSQRNSNQELKLAEMCTGSVLAFTLKSNETCNWTRAVTVPAELNITVPSSKIT